MSQGDSNKGVKTSAKDRRNVSGFRVQLREAPVAACGYFSPSRERLGGGEPTGGGFLKAKQAVQTSARSARVNEEPGHDDGEERRERVGERGPPLALPRYMTAGAAGLDLDDVNLVDVTLVLDSTIRLAVPLIFACLAGLYSERAGIVSVMSCSACFSPYQKENRSATRAPGCAGAVPARRAVVSGAAVIRTVR